MFETNEQKKAFLRQFNITEDKFRESMLAWDELSLIAEDYLKRVNGHTATVKQYFDEIQRCAYVHSLSYRVKDVTHLIEKIIRKNPQYLKQGKSISHKNYSKYINDLMGIRVLLLFKEDWNGVHDFIMRLYGDDLAEAPFAYIRKGDDRDLYAEKISIKDEKPYRSVHYLIRDKKTHLCIEVQVRTLFEEAWSEIDHQLRYPYNLSNEMLASYLEIMNRAAGMADEMGTFLHAYLNDFENVMNDGVIDDNEVYSYILDQTKYLEDGKIKENIIEKIKKAQKYKELTSTQELFKDTLKKYRKEAVLMGNMAYKTLKEELNTTFDDEYIYNAGTLIHQMAEEFFKEQNLEGKVYFDDSIFEYCLIDILVDIARLRYFHDIELVNYIKLMAYTASWCLKRKPFQLLEGSGADYIYINEKFALSLLLQASGGFNNDMKCAEKDKVKVEKSIEQIFYHLKYRNTNPQTLELLLVGIGEGKLLYEVG